MPHIVWDEESKAGLGFEIGPIYDDTQKWRPNVQLMGNPAVSKSEGLI